MEAKVRAHPPFVETILKLQSTTQLLHFVLSSTSMGLSLNSYYLHGRKKALLSQAHTEEV